MKIARDIMTRNPFALKSSMQVETAVQEMLTHHISSAPVLDGHQKLLGQVSEITLLKAYILSSKEGSEKVLLDYQKSFSQPSIVREIDPIDKVVKSIIESPYNRVLVLDSRGHLRGIISPKDILRYLMGEKSRSGTLVQEMQVLQDRISILKDQLHATKTQLNTIDSMVEQSEFMFYSVDAQAKIVIANIRLHQDLGYGPRELIGKSVLDIYPAEDRKRVEDSLRQMIGDGKSQKTYSTYLTQDGKHLRVEVISHPIFDATGSFLATSTVSRVLDQDSLLRALHGVYD